MNQTKSLSQDTLNYSIVIPVYNSATMLFELYERLVMVMESLQKPFEIIFVDDCGQDNSWQVLQTIANSDNRVIAIQLMRNFGQGSASLCGLAHAKGLFIITMDDDLQHPPEELPTLIYSLESNENLDVVMGVAKKRKHTLFRRLGSNFINWLNNYFLKKDPNLTFSSLRIMRRSVADGVLTMRVPYPALSPMIISVTRRIANVELKHDSRKHGQSNYNLYRIIKQTLSILIGYSILPLHLLAIIGSFGILSSFCVGIFYLIRYLLIGIPVPGWTSLILVIMILSGFNFFAFAVIGEYLIRIFYLGSTSQQFIIRNVINLDDQNP